MKNNKSGKKVNRLKAFFDLKWWFYDFVKVTGFIPITLYLRSKFIYKNKEYKKEFKKDPIMIAANHRDFLDPFLMVSVFTFKRVGIIATKELFNTKFKKALFTGFRAIYIDKENVSIKTFKAVNEVIKDGHSVGIFPEGTIVHKDGEEISEFKAGVIMMALMAKAPIYPIYFAKRNHWYQRQRIYVGERFNVSDYFEGKKPSGEKMAEVAELLRQKVIELSNMHKEYNDSRLRKKH
jgi:1-acyl-sn-glycerol-3-phosphate acyltransferase